MKSVIATLAACAALAVALPALAQTATTATPTAAVPDWRMVDPENTLVIDTNRGRIIVELAPALAPGHVERIKTLTRRGFYDGIIFHRVIDTFMAQTGDPQGTGTGGSDLPDLTAEFSFRRGADSGFVRAISRSESDSGWIGAVPVESQAEFRMRMNADRRVRAWINHCPGVASMARSSDPNSANSQFFLMRQATSHLDQQYSPWGVTVVGLDIVRAITTGEPPPRPDRMEKVRILADIPAPERPQVRVERADGPRFQARLAAMLPTAGATFSNCDLIPRGEIVTR